MIPHGVVSDPVLYMLCALPFLGWAIAIRFIWKKKGHAMMEKIGPWLDKKMHALRVWLIDNKHLPKERLHRYPRQLLVNMIDELESELFLAEDRLKEAWGRHAMAASMVTSYGQGRMKIIENLERWGMTLDKDNGVVMKGHRMYPPVIKDGVVVRPSIMVPVMALGLESPVPPPYEGDTIPIICWYRLVPDPKIKGQINEEYSHYEDAEMVLQDPKNRKNKKMIIKLPTGNLPPPRGGTVFSGKWTWHQKFRTQETSPRVLDDVTVLIKEKAAGRFKDLREQYKDFPDSGPIFGK